MLPIKKKLNANGNVTEIGAEQSMFVLTILEKSKKRLKLSQGSTTALKNMANDEEARVKITNTQL